MLYVSYISVSLGENCVLPSVIDPEENEKGQPNIHSTWAAPSNSKNLSLT